MKLGSNPKKYDEYDEYEGDEEGVGENVVEVRGGSFNEIADNGELPDEVIRELARNHLD